MTLPLGGNSVPTVPASELCEGDDDGEEDDLSADFRSGVHMSCVYHNGYIGCAWYDINSGEVYAMNIIGAVHIKVEPFRCKFAHNPHCMGADVRCPGTRCS
jgi:hypothetical protein